MFDSQILEVAIGLMGICMILSVICSAIKEWAAAIMRWRAKFLEMGLKKLLSDNELVKKFYEHPLIASISNGPLQCGSQVNFRRFATSGDS